MKLPACFSQVRWRVTLFLAVVSVLNYADRSALSAVLAPLQREFNLSDVRLSMLLSLFLWCYALASPFAGMISDRYSRPRLLVASILTWSVFTALIGWANGLVMLCVLSVGLGFGESVFIPASFALLAGHHGADTRAKAMSLLSVGAQLGVVAGGACAGFLAQHYGWRTGFWVLGLIGIGLALAGRFILVEGSGSTGGPPVKPGAAETFRYLLRVRSYHLLLAKQILAEATTWMFFGWLPLYLFESFHLALGTAGLLGTSMLQVFLVVGYAVGGWVSDRLAARGAQLRLMALAGCYLLAAPFPLVFLGHPGLVAVAAAVSVCSLFRGLGTANERPIVCDIVPARFRSTAYGVMNTCATAAGAMGVLFAGLLKRQFGLHTAFACAAAPFLLTGLVLLVGCRLWMPRDLARCREFEAADVPTA